MVPIPHNGRRNGPYKSGLRDVPGSARPLCPGWSQLAFPPCPAEGPCGQHCSESTTDAEGRSSPVPLNALQEAPLYSIREARWTPPANGPIRQPVPGGSLDIPPLGQSEDRPRAAIRAGGEGPVPTDDFRQMSEWSSTHLRQTKKSSAPDG